MVTERLHERFRAVATKRAIPPTIMLLASAIWAALDFLGHVHTIVWISDRLPRIGHTSPSELVPYIPLLMFISALVWLAVIAFLPKPETDPRIIVELENEELENKETVPIILLRNCGGTTAFEVQIETMVLDVWKIRFPIIPVLRKGESGRVKPEIERSNWTDDPEYIPVGRVRDGDWEQALKEDGRYTVAGRIDVECLVTYLGIHEDERQYGFEPIKRRFFTRVIFECNSRTVVKESSFGRVELAHR